MPTKIQQQKPTNANETIQNRGLAEIPVGLQEFIITTANGIVETQIQQSPFYRVQCVDSEKAANLLGVEPDTIRNWIKSGKLQASKIGKEWLIRVIEIEKILSANATAVRMVDKRYKRKAKAKII